MTKKPISLWTKPLRRRRKAKMYPMPRGYTLQLYDYKLI